jgi:hypothetical protein
MSVKHANGVPACPACELKLADAHPSLAKWFRQEVKPHFRDCHISWSYRGKADQEQCFLDGKSKAHYPNSMHNKTDKDGKPQALALDFFCLDFNGIARWSYGYMRDIADEAAKQPCSISWGVHCPGLSEWDHFQMAIDHDA